MRIISKIKDYYDYIQGMGIDPSIVYHRIGDNGMLPNYQKSRIYETKSKVSVQEIEIYIAGYKYKMFAVPKKDNFHEYYVNIDEVVKKYGPMQEYYWVQPDYMNGLDIFDSRRFDQNVYDYQKSIRVPVIIAGMFYPYDVEKGWDKRYITGKYTVGDGVVYNPSFLGEIGFANIIPADIIFSMISNFILVMGEKPMIEVSDISKLEKAGFDKRVSFRHRS